MRYVILIVLLGCVTFGVSMIVFGLATPVVLDMSAHPVEIHSYFHQGYTAVRELVQDLIDGFTAPIRGRTERINTPEPLPR